MKSYPILLALCVHSLSQNALAEPLEQTLPKWEIGIGPGFLSYPDYPGSKEQNNLLVPFPYITYRSDAFTIDQREIKKPLYEYRNLEFDLSIAGTIPVSSKDNQARDGMDDLDASIGIGPEIKARLYRNDLNEFKFEWPVRWVLASDLRSIHEEGFVTSPGFYYYFRQGFTQRKRLKITLGTRADFATARNNNYFYGVDEAYATADRPAYKASGGFAGMAYIVSLNWHIGDFWLGGFYRLRDLSGSVYEDSPLMETTRAETYGFAITWNFYQSDTTVQGLE
ncbi:MAG: MipA/OmpV family protein [Hydrogenovibrio sp.]